MKPDFCRAPELESGDEQGVVPVIEGCNVWIRRQVSPSGCGSRKADEGGTDGAEVCISRA